ncbi:MAG TPA: hypothetical protein VGG14_17280 [Candidatus Sulfotelmatobacter sp.]|jgi:hypothetical protein
MTNADLLDSAVPAETALVHEGGSAGSASSDEMTMQGLFICEAVASEKEPFIEFWAGQYRYELEHLYETNISIKPFTDDAIGNLYEWKNGRKLSEKKKQSVEGNYIAHKEHDLVKRAAEFVPTGSPADTANLAKEFLSHFSKGGAIWRIFWLHCCNQRFPIYDQHVHRAMVFIEEGRIEELDDFSDEKIELYLTKYLEFHARFPGDQRKVDKALVTFGRFLKEWSAIAAASLKA